ncbi:CDI toxin immunity protein [Paenibacillus sp. M.A.Huq-81]
MQQSGDRKWRIEQLLHKMKSKQKPAYSSLLEECVEALGEGTIVLSDQTSDKMSEELSDAYCFTAWGKFNWSKIPNQYHVNNAAEVVTALNVLKMDVELPVFIIWDGDHPVLETKWLNVMDAIDDVLAVDFNTYIYCPNHYVVEFYRGSEITIGWV